MTRIFLELTYQKGIELEAKLNTYNRDNSLIKIINPLIISNNF